MKPRLPCAALAPRDGRRPFLSVIMPLRDEAATLDAAVRSVLAQQYPGDFEVVLAVAPSTDDTLGVAERAAERNRRVRVVANPRGSTSAGLNAAIAACSGSVVARVDGHAELSDGYLERAVELLDETGADNVGGIQDAQGETPFERAVAAAMTSRFGTGDAKFHYGGAPGPTDTVYLGVFRRDVFDRVGGFDETLVRNQDYELNWRIREAGGTVYFDPDLRVRYRPRGSWRGLARQYFQYGRWKRAVGRRHPRSLRWRHLVPPATVVAIGFGTALGVWVETLFLLAPLGYLIALAVASVAASVGRRGRASLWVPVVFMTMHFAWAVGFLIPVRSRRAMSPTVPPARSG